MTAKEILQHHSSCSRGGLTLPLPPMPPPDAPKLATLTIVVHKSLSEGIAKFDGVVVEPVSLTVGKVLARDSDDEGNTPFAQVTIRGISSVDVDQMALAMVRLGETSSSLTTASEGACVRLAVFIPVPVADLFLRDDGEVMKAICKKCVSPLRLVVEPVVEQVNAIPHRLVVLLGLPEALHTALPELNHLAQEWASQAKEDGFLRLPAAFCSNAIEQQSETDKRKATIDVTTEPSCKRRAPVCGAGSGGDYNLVGEAGHVHKTSAGPVSSAARDGEGSLWDWLSELDQGSGEMLIYFNNLSENFDNVSELSLVACGPNDERPDPQLFIDIGVELPEHRKLFQDWFQQHGMPLCEQFA